jgi:formate-nitrite transporter family protein
MTLTDPVRLREVRGQLGPTDAPAEDQLAEAFETIVSEGTRRLHRTWREMIPTGPGWLGALSGSG